MKIRKFDIIFWAVGLTALAAFFIFTFGNIHEFSITVLKACTITLVVDVALMVLLAIYAIFFAEPIND
jgi:hypothetical protein